jgi:hypothetical protein
MFRAFPLIGCLLSFFLLAATSVRSAGTEATPAEPIRTVVAKALPLLQKGAAGHMEQRTCFACHNQGVPLLAFTTARQRGFAIPEEDLKKQGDFIAAFLKRNGNNLRRGQGLGGEVDTAGYALLALEVQGWKPDATTEAAVEYFLARDKDRDHWRTTSHRPPSEASDFTPTYLALRALLRWSVPGQKARITKRISAVREWLVQTPAKDTEDRVFRLWALKSAGANDKALQSATKELVQSQRPDGGWRQTATLESDAYATGSALVALYQAGGMSTSDPVYQCGLAFLMKTQRADGSWLVHSRSQPFQTYYESGFPHGKDQFISMAATAWATTALALACPPVPHPD